MATERLSPATADEAELLFHWHRYRAVVPWVRGCSVLDVGAGDGYGAYALAADARFVTAVDVDPETVRHALGRYQRANLRYVVASATDLPFPDAAFDVVTMFEMIEHVSSTDQERTLREIRRVLRPGGLVFLSTPDRTRTAAFETANPYHVAELTEAELVTLLGRYFSHVRVFYQEITAASVIWDPRCAAEVGRLGGIARTANGSEPAAFGQDLHLYLIAVAGDTPFAGDLSGVLVSRDRGLLERLWAELGRLRWELGTLDDVREQLRTAEQARAVLWEENRRLAEDCLALHREIDRLKAEVARLPNLEEAARRLDVILASRSWRLIKRYWDFMDTSPARGIAQAVRTALFGRPKTPKSEEGRGRGTESETERTRGDP